MRKYPRTINILRMKKIKIVFGSHAKELTELEVNTDTIIHPLKSVDFLHFLVYNTHNVAFAMNLKRSGGVVVMPSPSSTKKRKSNRTSSTKKTSKKPNNDVTIIVTKKKIKTVLATKADNLTGLKDLINSKLKSNTGGERRIPLGANNKLYNR